MVASSPIWEARSLREVVTKLVDGSHNPPPKQDTGLPMLSTRNIDRGQVLFDDYRLISESAFASENARTRIAPGDVLLTIVGTIGRTAVVPEGSQPFSLQRSVAVLTPSANLLPKFLCYQLESPAIQKHFEANARGTAQKGVYLKTLGQTPVVLPPVDLQREIVAELEKQFSRLDEAVANLQRVKANLKRYKASVLKAAVEGRLVETEATLARREGRTFETGEQLLQRILEERRAKWRGKGRYKEPVAQTAEFTIAVTDGWTSATVDQLASVQLGKMLDKQKHKAGEPYRYLRNINVRWGTFDVSDVFEMNFESDELERFSVRAGDVLVCEGGEPARAAVWRAKQTDMKYQKALHRVRFDGAYLPDLIVIALEHLAKSGALDELYGGSTIKHFTRETFVKLVLPVPPAAEQARIVAEVDRHLSIIREVEVEVEANLQRAQALRQATLAKAFANT